jgi:hypothetical protein
MIAGVAAPSVARAQDDTHERHGRKYKAPPETAHIEVLVQKGFNKKPIMNAAVIFHPIDADGKDEGTLEVKSGPDGKASLDVIPIGSQVRLQVLANGFATYAQDFTVDAPSRSFVVSMIRPEAQISAYEDNEGKPSNEQPGIQVPIRPKPKSSKNSGSSTGSAADKSGSGNASSGSGATSSQGSGDNSGSAQGSTKPQL